MQLHKLFFAMFVVNEQYLVYKLIQFFPKSTLWQMMDFNDPVDELLIG
jgi:hypothetical protein